MKVYEYKNGDIKTKKLIKCVEISNFNDILKVVSEVLKEMDINSPYQRYLGTDKSNLMCVDYGSYSRFLLLEEDNLNRMFEEGLKNE